MADLRIGSLFSGIGGLELGLERAGLGRVAWQVEIDPFCRGVLARHWPEAVRHDDVRTAGSATLDAVDLVCGGFPCQDVSLAGRRAGLDGERSGLWFEYRRIVEELAPSIVVVENVLGLRTSGLRRVLQDLADLGFDAEWSDLAAADVGAPHRRRRLFIVATHPDRIELRDQHGWIGRACRAVAAITRYDGEWRHVAYANREQRIEPSCERDFPSWRDVAHTSQGRITPDAYSLGRYWERCAVECNAKHLDLGRAHEGRQADRIYPWRPPVSPIRRVDDGIPDRSHGKRLKALGNAVVPQCAEVIGRAILAAMT